MKTAIELIKELRETLTHFGPHMGGKDKYALSLKSQPIIREMLLLVSEQVNTADAESEVCDERDYNPPMMQHDWGKEF